MLKKYLELLYKSKDSPLEQIALVKDISRRGFLKQIIEVTLLGSLAKTCCAYNEYSTFLPDLGDTDRRNMSNYDADQLGRKIIQDIFAQNSMANDYDALTYLNDLGGTLASYSSLSSQNFSFYLIKDKQINAFALPGGYICIYNGLIYTTASEAELCSVMSHEIGHIVQHHIFRNISVYDRNQWLALSGILAGALLALANPAAAILAVQGGYGLAVQNILSFSRDFEREADRVGQKIMYNAGYDPQAMPAFFKRLYDQNKFNDNEAYAFLRSHPVTSERISEAQSRANQLHVKMRPDSNSFLLVREKCRSRQIGPKAAINFYEKSLSSKRYTSISAQYYGLALANYMLKNINNSISALNQITEPNFKNHPIVLNLRGKLLITTKNYTLAKTFYKDALLTYPEYKGLWLEEANLYIAAKEYLTACQKLDDLSQTYPGDLDIWVKQEQLYSDAYLNNEQKYHYARGNGLYLLGNYPLALDQYQLALKPSSKPSKTDPVLNNQIVAKIFDTQERIAKKR